MIKHAKTLKVRIKDKHIPLLRKQAMAVNFVWNFVNALSQRSFKERGVFLFAYDIQKYTNGAGKDLGLHIDILPDLKDGDSLYRTAMPDRKNVLGRIDVAVVSDTTLTASPFSYSQT